MSRLSLSDRGRLAQTCRVLEGSFCHPSLWKTVTIVLRSFIEQKYGPICEILPIVEPASYLARVERFGAYFKDLTLLYTRNKNPMSRDCVDVIQCIMRCCRYEILTLNASSHAFVMCPTDLNILAQLFTNQCLKSFTLIGVTRFDIRVLLSNDKLSGCLERLSLDWHSAGSTARTNIIGPTPGQMVAATSQFTQLRALYLQSPMLSDDLIVNLSNQGRAPLRELGILETDASQLVGGKLPHIEASSWTRLCAYSPCLQVHVILVSWVTNDELFRFLLPEVPLASISFSKHSDCSDLCSLADRFSSTLRKFVASNNYPSWLDAELVYMVTKCSHLVDFEYKGTLPPNTIRELAGLRGSRWRHFLVDRDDGDTLDDDSDDDVTMKQLAADVALITRK